MQVDHSLGNGVFYAMEDYATFGKRIIVLLVDGFVLAVLGATTLAVASFVLPLNVFYTMAPLILFACLFVCWLYLVILKRSDVRTIAYRLLNLKIVNTKGVRPSIVMMTLRMMLWIVGPFNLVLDLVWLGADSERQSLRDCFAQTYVVRNSAKPIGSGPIHLTRFYGGGFALSYPRVIRPHRAESGDED